MTNHFSAFRLRCLVKDEGAEKGNETDRDGMTWTELSRRLEGVPDGLYAVQVLLQIGLLEV